MTARDGAVAGPRTLVGQWLREAALQHFRARDGKRESIKSTGGWTRGRIELTHEAFALFAQRWFDLDRGPAAVRTVALSAAERFERHGIRLFEIEAMIRAALGEDLPIDTLAPATYFKISQALFNDLAGLLSPAVAAVDLMLADAERAVVLGGLTPFTPAEAELTGITIDDLR